MLCTVVIREAVGIRDASAHEQHLFDMPVKYSKVVSTDETLAYLNFSVIQVVSTVLTRFKSPDFSARVTLATTSTRLRFHQPRKLEFA